MLFWLDKAFKLPMMFSGYSALLPARLSETSGSITSRSELADRHSMTSNKTRRNKGSKMFGKGLMVEPAGTIDICEICAQIGADR
jgi:hypothetical protein